MKKLIGILALALIAAPATAQDAPKATNVNMAGNWDFSFTSPQGTANWRIKFEQSADTLWGTATTDFGPLNVTDGWVAGNDVSFTLSLNYEGTPISLNFTGTVKTDTINGQIDVPGVGIQPFAFTGVKVTGYQSSRVFPSLPVRPERPRLIARDAR